MSIVENERTVIISGQIFLYRAKAPFVESGLSVAGAIEYDGTMDKLRCHECGCWFKGLGAHVVGAHSISARQYKLRHRLNIGSALVSESIRSALIKRHSIGDGGLNLRHARLAPRLHPAVRTNSLELRNINGSCPAQVLSKIHDLALKLGHSPSKKEARAHGVCSGSTISMFGVKWREIQSMAGLTPNKRGNHKKYTQNLLLEMLRTFYAVHGRLPSSGSDVRRKLIPSRTIFRLYFGTFHDAVIMAGLKASRKRAVKAA